MRHPRNYTTYAQDIAEMDSDELFNTAKVMEDLMNHPGWAVVMDLASQRSQSLLARCEPPNIPQREEYAGWHGMRSGIEQVLDLPGAMVYGAKRREAQLAETAGREA